MQTNMLKTIITNEGDMLIEKKRVQAYTASIFAKLMGFGNGTLTAAMTLLIVMHGTEMNVKSVFTLLLE